MDLNREVPEVPEAADSAEWVAVARPVGGERSTAALAHGGAFLALLVPFGQLLVPGLVWLIAQRRAADRAESAGGVPYAAHHAREAFRFQLLMLLAAWPLKLAYDADLPRRVEALFLTLLVLWLSALLGLTLRAVLRAAGGELACYSWVRARWAEATDRSEPGGESRSSPECLGT